MLDEAEVDRVRVHVQGQPATGQQHVVGGLARQQGFAQAGQVLEQRWGSRNHALAQRGAGGQQFDAQ